ncbi:MAG: hypothetical protein FWH02_02410 [Oscillospiraceae bacterium]|nr:hypothetical protein [Oscillospiraceae bacterium]
MKNILAFIIIAALVVGVMPMAVFADSLPTLKVEAGVLTDFTTWDYYDFKPSSNPTIKVTHIPLPAPYDTIKANPHTGDITWESTNNSINYIMVLAQVLWDDDYAGTTNPQRMLVELNGSDKSNAYLLTEIDGKTYEVIHQGAFTDGDEKVINNNRLTFFATYAGEYTIEFTIQEEISGKWDTIDHNSITINVVCDRHVFSGDLCIYCGAPMTSGGGKAESTVTIGSGSSSSGSSGGGGGGSGGSAPAATPPPETSGNVSSGGTVNSSAVVSELAEAITGESGSTQAVVRTRNAASITPSTINALANAAQNAGKEAVIHADTVNSSGAVEGRLYVETSKLTGMSGDLLLGVTTTGPTPTARKNLFERFFSNNISVVSFAHQGGFGAKLKVAAKVALPEDIANLRFYSYNAATNAYREVTTVYVIDKNGYLHFITALAGDIIISDGPLTRR